MCASVSPVCACVCLCVCKCVCMRTCVCVCVCARVCVPGQEGNQNSTTSPPYSRELLAQAPGDCITPAHSACLVHRYPGLPGVLFSFVYVCVDARSCGTVSHRTY